MDQLMYISGTTSEWKWNGPHVDLSSFYFYVGKRKEKQHTYI